MDRQNRKKIIGYSLLALFIAVVFFMAGIFSTIVWNWIHPKYQVGFPEEKVELVNIIRFNHVKNILLNDYYEPVDENALVEGMIRGMAESLDDPYTTYYNPEEMNLFLERSGGSYVGIGVTVYMDENDILTVSESFPDSPAKKVGMKKGDKIVDVDGEDVTMIGDSDIIIQKIKGEPNTSVKITVFRPEINDTIDFDVVREVIKLQYVESKVLEEKIGYLRIKQFDEDISNEFKEHMEDLMGQGIKGLVLDLRDNPGGDYNEVVKIADSFLPKGLIVYTEDRNGHREEQSSDANELKLPLSVLINGYSASASEILSASIKDYKKGTLIGTTTFGKGLVQQILPIEGGAGIKLTIARYFTPSGVCIHGIGVTPDIEVTIDEKYEYYAVGEIPFEDDAQLQKAIEVVKAEIQ